eukprot:TRINITY_DN9532_c0_g1_i1.p1 TRINITY_DN9532_c0_g1~~TRINITY_DN9532_c0_g1_i1.p1  ORF type:complete len:215 (-),score=27.77 TRINITY_DN9532_c0_g1_i1:135-779(-)
MSTAPIVVYDEVLTDLEGTIMFPKELSELVNHQRFASKEQIQRVLDRVNAILLTSGWRRALTWRIRGAVLYLLVSLGLMLWFVANVNSAVRLWKLLVSLAVISLLAMMVNFCYQSKVITKARYSSISKILEIQHERNHPKEIQIDLLDFERQQITWHSQVSYSCLRLIISVGEPTTRRVSAATLLLPQGRQQPEKMPLLLNNSRYNPYSNNNSK